jgi:GT2 family glycosyltransferase
MDRNSLIYIIILSYKGSKYILKLLHSIYQSSYNNFTVLLVDNNSEDDTVKTVKKHFPTCKVIVNKSNLGFARGCNVGLKKAIEDNAEFIFLLNQDCLIQKDTLSNLLISAQNKPFAGVLGPKTWFFPSSRESKPRINYAGAWRCFLPLVQRVPGVGKYDDGQYNLTVPVDYVWGHGMFLRAKILQESGLFDPNFFMYYEDLDLCHRMAKAEYQVWYEPSAVIWHDIPDTARGSASESWRWEYKCRSAHIFHCKYYGKIFAFILDILTLQSEILRLLWAGHIIAARDLAQAWVRTMRTTQS